MNIKLMINNIYLIYKNIIITPLLLFVLITSRYLSKRYNKRSNLFFLTFYDIFYETDIIYDISTRIRARDNKY